MQTRMVNLRVSEDLIEEFEIIAESEGANKSALMKKALERGLANIKQMGTRDVETFEEMTQVYANIEKNTDIEIEKICKEANVSKPRIIAALIECGLEDVRFLSFLGLRPSRLQKIAKALQKIGLFADVANPIKDGNP